MAKTGGHHPKTDVDVAVVWGVPEAEGGAQEVPVEVERPATQHPQGRACPNRGQPVGPPAVSPLAVTLCHPPSNRPISAIIVDA